MHSIWIHVGWTGQAGNCVWQAWTSTWPTLASHLNVEQLEDALAGLNDVIQGLENYGKKGVESCKEGGEEFGAKLWNGEIEPSRSDARNVLQKENFASYEGIKELSMSADLQIRQVLRLSVHFVFQALPWQCWRVLRRNGQAADASCCPSSSWTWGVLAAY